jgi:hypothetical protein
MRKLAEIESAIEALPMAEQTELLNRLVMKLGGSAIEFPVREDHLRLLDERFAAHRRELRAVSPGQVLPVLTSTWEEVKRRFAASSD